MSRRSSRAPGDYPIQPPLSELGLPVRHRPPPPGPTQQTVAEALGYAGNLSAQNPNFNGINVGANALMSGAAMWYAGADLLPTDHSAPVDPPTSISQVMDRMYRDNAFLQYVTQTRLSAAPRIEINELPHLDAVQIRDRVTGACVTVDNLARVAMEAQSRTAFMDYVEDALRHAEEDLRNRTIRANFSPEGEP